MRRVAVWTLFIAVGVAAPAQADFTRVTGSGLETPGDKDGGLCWADFNDDGFLDVLVNTMSDDAANRSRLLFSDGALPSPSFTDVTDTHAAGFTREVTERSAIAADLNNDGYNDIIRNRYPRLEIYLNQGPGGTPPFSFGDASQDPQFVITPAVIPGQNTEGVGIIDVNNDGWLDVVVDNHGNGFIVLENPTDGTANFNIVLNSAVTGLPDSGNTAGDYAAVTDYDADGFVDLVGRKDVGLDLFRNNGDGTFTGQTEHDFSAPNGNKGGVVFCDFDDDGDFDLFRTDGGVDQIGSAGVNQIFRNDAGVFVASGAPATAPAGNIDGAACADVDHDGDLDLFVTSDGNDTLFRNDTNGGPLAFTVDNLNITGAEDGEGAVFADYDQDGDLDLLINQDNGNELWRNNTDDGNYLLVQVLADVGDCPGGRIYRTDLGAVVRLLDADGNPISGIREVNGGKGHGSQGAPDVHFGLPGGPDEEVIVWVNFQYGTEPDAYIPVTPSALGAYQRIIIRSSDPDGDGILTSEEMADAANHPGGDDIDGDGHLNWHDTDADGDGISDADEAGDADPCTPAVDSDGDGLPDYTDTDGPGPGPTDDFLLQGGGGCRCAVQTSGTRGSWGWLLGVLAALLVWRRRRAR